MKVIVNGLTKEVRNEFHLNVQKHNRTQLVTPKKGKGSFKRKSKYGKDFE